MVNEAGLLRGWARTVTQSDNVRTIRSMAETVLAYGETAKLIVKLT